MQNKHQKVCLPSVLCICKQILHEVKSSNRALKGKVTQLEKTVSALEKSAQSKKKLKVAPFCEERVSSFVLCRVIVLYGTTE